MNYFALLLPRRAFFYACVCAAILVLAVRAPLPVFPWVSSGDDATSLASALDQLRVVPLRLRVLGYEREQFGSGWASAVTATGEYGDTRDVVLVRAGGADEYTGRPTEDTAMDIDHIYPLAAAWDMGAWSWSTARRVRFANDVELNLVATESAVNREKSDSTPGEWMPPFPANQCGYALRFVRVAVEYQLAITEADEIRARRACGDLTKR